MEQPPPPSRFKSAVAWALDTEHGYKIALFAGFLIAFTIIALIWKVVSNDPQDFKDLGILLMLLAVTGGFVLTRALERWAGAADAFFPTDNPSGRRATIYVLIGFGVAFALATGISVSNCRETAAIPDRARAAQAERDERARLESAPGVQYLKDHPEALDSIRDRAATRRTGP